MIPLLFEILTLIQYLKFESWKLLWKSPAAGHMLVPDTTGILKGVQLYRKLGMETSINISTQVHVNLRDRVLGYSIDIINDYLGNQVISSTKKENKQDGPGSLTDLCNVIWKADNIVNHNNPFYGKVS